MQRRLLSIPRFSFLWSSGTSENASALRSTFSLAQNLPDSDNKKIFHYLEDKRLDLHQSVLLDECKSKPANRSRSRPELLPPVFLPTLNKTRYFGTAAGNFGSNSDSTMSVPRNDTKKSPYVVGHDSKQKMFYIKLQDESKIKEESVAKLEYEWVRRGLVDLYHTEVPPAFQGQGIAKVLVLAGLDHFCEQDVLIRPTCTYVQKVLRENQTSCYKDHVEESFSTLFGQ